MAIVAGTIGRGSAFVLFILQETDVSAYIRVKNRRISYYMFNVLLQNGHTFKNMGNLSPFYISSMIFIVGISSATASTRECSVSHSQFLTDVPPNDELSGGLY